MDCLCRDRSHPPDSRAHAPAPAHGARKMGRAGRTARQRSRPRARTGTHRPRRDRYRRRARPAARIRARSRPAYPARALQPARVGRRPRQTPVAETAVGLCRPAVGLRRCPGGLDDRARAGRGLRARAARARPAWPRHRKQGAPAAVDRPGRGCASRARWLTLARRRRRPGRWGRRAPRADRRPAARERAQRHHRSRPRQMAGGHAWFRVQRQPG